ncbi:MAG: hypothetical protein ACFFAK_13115 [Promethearchaeota archaeon]
MEQRKWEKDQTPYVVFICTKCQQYSYVKTTQKTKKCLRCGRIHQVRNILDKGEIVYGMTEAVNKVKQQQNSLGEAQFSIENEFILFSAPKALSDKLTSKEKEDYTLTFQALLNTLASRYKKFPAYMIEILAKDYDIPPLELKLLIRRSIKNGVLKYTEKAYFTLLKV